MRCSLLAWRGGLAGLGPWGVVVGLGGVAGCSVRFFKDFKRIN